MFKKLFVSGTTACFELVNKNPYYSPKSYEIMLDGKKVEGVRNTNVVSLYGLIPATEYVLTSTLDGGALRFTTANETGVINVKSLGAKGDGVSDDTYYVQMAIDSCPAGGRVTFDEGAYLVRPIELKSHITVELKKGATLLGSPREEDYPYECGKIVRGDKEEIFASWEGEPFDCHKSFVSGYKVCDIKIVGEGVIDGNAQNSTWWATPKGRKVARPRLVFFNKCRNMVMHGVTCKNSASWNLHPYFSSKLGFYDLNVKNPSNAPNTDGLDPESCDKVDIIGCRFSVGDDCCAIKSGKVYMGMKYKTPANRHTLRNNLFEDGHGAIVLGSEMSGGVQNLSVTQCVFRHTDRGLRIKTRRGRGKFAVVDGVVFENIIMENVATPIVINMYYFCDPDGRTDYVRSREKGKYPVGDDTPYLGKFLFKDMICTDCECMAGYLDGLVEQPVKEVVIENVKFSFKKDARASRPAMLDGVNEYCRGGLYIDNVETLVLRGVSFEGVVGDELIEGNCGRIIKE